MSKFPGVIAAAAASIAFSASAQAATLQNGSFEDPGTLSGKFEVLNAGSDGLTGWTIGGKGVDLINTNWEHADGDYSIDLSGKGAGVISQTVTGLVVGQKYRISFALAGNPAGDNRVKTLAASIGMAGGGIFQFDTTDTAKNDMGWVMESFDFIAGATEGLLSFASVEDSKAGPALDNITIAALPLPAGGVFLLTGLAALGLRRRFS